MIAVRTGPVPLQGALATPEALPRSPGITPQEGDSQPRRARRQPADAEPNGFPPRLATAIPMRHVHVLPFEVAGFGIHITRRREAEDVERLTEAVAGARDLNPHQVHAALLAVRSPLAKGALLAGEVGLVKTVKAGLVIAQR